VASTPQKTKYRKNLYTLLTPYGKIKKIYKDGEGLVIKNKKIQKNPNITFFHKQL